MIELAKEGWSALRAHARLGLGLMLVFVLPALFLYFYTSEATVARKNLNTVLLEKISTVHDVIAAGIKSGTDIKALSSALTAAQKDIVRLELITEVDGRYVVTYDAIGDAVGTELSEVQPLRSALIEPGTTYIYQYEVNGSYREQAFRAIIGEGGTATFIFTEHDFTPVYALFAARGTEPLVIFGFIFLFIMALAYWLARQINYEQLYLEALETLKERDLFMNSLVHELRAPLTAMRGYASMIAESAAVPVTERGFATRIVDSTARLVTLVNDFLEAARVQSGQLALSLVTTDAGILLAKVHQAAELAASAKGLTLHITTPADPVSIVTDPKRLEQVLTNIVNNAIKYTPQGSVTLELRETAHGVTFTIADTGAGISAEDQRKVFAPFVRVGSARDREKITGSGLGMWITKQLVAQLKGTINLESIKGVGTHVIIAIPRELP